MGRERRVDDRATRPIETVAQSGGVEAGDPFTKFLASALTGSGGGSDRAAIGGHDRRGALDDEAVLKFGAVTREACARTLGELEREGFVPGLVGDART